MISNPALAVPDVGINGLINLLEGVLDWRLTLSAMPRAGAPMKACPQIAVSLRGPVSAPRPTIDVAAFSSWLAARAINQQSKEAGRVGGSRAGAAAIAVVR
jgi:hypothetical protein